MSKTAVHQILRNRKQVITGADYNGEKEYHRFSHGNLYPHSILHKKNVITVISFPVRQVQKEQADYVDALLEEINAAEEGKGRSVSSVFIGGGTPSVLDERFIGEILNHIRRKISDCGSC